MNGRWAIGFLTVVVTCAAWADEPRPKVPDDWQVRACERGRFRVLWPQEIDTPEKPDSPAAILWALHGMMSRSARSPGRGELTLSLSVIVPRDKAAPAKSLREHGEAIQAITEAAGQKFVSRGAVTTKADEAIEYVVSDAAARSWRRIRVHRATGGLVTLEVRGDAEAAVNGDWATRFLGSFTPIK
jgi:hypothetical protein